MIADIPIIYSALHFTIHAILIFRSVLQICSLCHIFKGFLSYLHVVIISCILFLILEHVLILLSDYFYAYLTYKSHIVYKRR